MKTEKNGEGLSAIGYMRVSTDKQDIENQRAAINAAAAREGIKIDFQEETISSRKTDRAIFKIIENLKAGQGIVVYELSRLGRSMLEVYSMIDSIKKKGGWLWSLTPELKIGRGENEIVANCTVFALSLAADIERKLISERTKAALKVKKEMGMSLGRPKGQGVKVNKSVIAAGYNMKDILAFHAAGMNPAQIGRLIKVHRHTVAMWLKNEQLQDEQTDSKKEKVK